MKIERKIRAIKPGTDDKTFFTIVQEASLICRAVNNRFSKRIIKLLELHPSITVTEILIHLRLEQSDTSYHLAILRRAGIVTTTRSGKYIYYQLNYHRIAQINSFIAMMLNADEP